MKIAAVLILLSVLATFSFADGLPGLPQDSSAQTAAALVSPSPAAQKGTLDISSVPSGADVFYTSSMAGKKAGKTPIKFDLPPGRYVIDITYEGFMKYSKVLDLKDKDALNLVAMLTPTPVPTPTPSPSPPPRPLDYNCSFNLTIDRVRCRLSLPNDEIARKNPQEPDECRSLDGKQRAECVSDYSKFAQCSLISNANEREKCATDAIALTDIKTMESVCERKRTDQNKSDCELAIRKKVYLMVKYRFQNLENQAEKLWKLGADKEKTVRFIAAVEQLKLDFNSAKNLEQRKQAVWDVKRLWGDYKRDAVADIISMKGSL